MTLSVSLSRLADCQRRVYLNVIQKSNDPEDSLRFHWKKLFGDEKFEVTVRDRRAEITKGPYRTQKRTVKDSAYWCKDVTTTNGDNL